MTNWQFIEQLPAEKQRECLKQYNEHPLSHYIDWGAFYDIEDGNEMHFLKYLRIMKDEFDNSYYVLEEHKEKNKVVSYVYSIIDNAFATITHDER